MSTDDLEAVKVSEEIYKQICDDKCTSCVHKDLLKYLDPCHKCFRMQVIPVYYKKDESHG